MQRSDSFLPGYPNVPSVILAAQDLWSFAEYVAMHRTHAVFGYRDGKFRVRFPHLTPRRFRQVLADWEAWRGGGAVEAVK